MIYLYNFFLALFIPLIGPYLLWRLVSGKDSLASVRQKLGKYDFPPPVKDGIWIHAVSVGETNTAVMLVDELLKRREKPPITFTTTTATGMALAVSKLDGKVTLAYFPFDFPGAVKAACAFFSPRVIVLMETEIWPNLLHHAQRSGIRTILVNGRLSDSSFSTYSLLRPLFRPFIRSIDSLLMQSPRDLEKIVSLGADKKRPVVGGNIKFDCRMPDDATSKAELRRRFRLPENSRVIVFASSHPGEDELFLQTARELSSSFAGLYPVIAPRHTHRAESIRKLCLDYGFAQTKLRTETGEDYGSALVLDTIGELANLYGAADIAVIGGSFIPHGGQNPLEASAWKLPVIFGPHMNNFREISEKLAASGGALQVADRAGLTRSVSNWMENEQQGRDAGIAGYNTILQNRGALQKTVEAVVELFETGNG